MEFLVELRIKTEAADEETALRKALWKIKAASVRGVLEDKYPDIERRVLRD